MNAHKNISPNIAASPDSMTGPARCDLTAVGAGRQPSMIYPVYGFSEPFRREVVASFFDLGAATDMVLHPTREGFEQRELYIGHPKYRAEMNLHRAVMSAAQVALCAQSGPTQWLLSIRELAKKLNAESKLDPQGGGDSPISARHVSR